jgi:hypothetical protein
MLALSYVSPLSDVAFDQLRLAGPRGCTFRQRSDWVLPAYGRRTKPVRCHYGCHCDRRGNRPAAEWRHCGYTRRADRGNWPQGHHSTRRHPSERKWKVSDSRSLGHAFPSPGNRSRLFGFVHRQRSRWDSRYGWGHRLHLAAARTRQVRCGSRPRNRSSRSHIG